MSETQIEDLTYEVYTEEPARETASSTQWFLTTSATRHGAAEPTAVHQLEDARRALERTREELHVSGDHDLVAQAERQLDALDERISVLRGERARDSALERMMSDLEAKSWRSNVSRAQGEDASA